MKPVRPAFIISFHGPLINTCLQVGNVSSEVSGNTTLFAEYLSYHFVHGNFQNLSSSSNQCTSLIFCQHKSLTILFSSFDIILSYSHINLYFLIYIIYQCTLLLARASFPPSIIGMVFPRTGQWYLSKHYRWTYAPQRFGTGQTSRQQ
jgi:hypothetical protein